MCPKCKSTNIKKNKHWSPGKFHRKCVDCLYQFDYESDCENSDSSIGEEALLQLTKKYGNIF